MQPLKRKIDEILKLQTQNIWLFKKVHRLACLVRIGDKSNKI
jgi:hypothetical protein